MSNEFEIEGFDELQRLIVAVGNVPQKVATKVSRQGANLILRNIKAKAPEGTTKLLKDALILVGEKNRPKGKKVYEITFDRRLSGDGENGLVKISKHTNKRGYYPASQEFGWDDNGHYVPGLNYMKNATEESISNAQQKIVDSAKTELDKIIAQYTNDMRR